MTNFIMERISKNPYFESKTFLITSNNPKVFEYCDRVLHLENGEITFDGKYNEANFKIERNDDKKNLEEKKIAEKKNVFFLLKKFFRRNFLIMKLRNMKMKLKEEQHNSSIWRKISQQ